MLVTDIDTASSAARVVQRDLDRLKEASGQIIGQMFFGTMLKKMRESKLNGTIGHGGRGETVFAAQLHGIYAERLGSSTKGGMREVLYDSMKRQQELISSQRGQVSEAH